MVTDVSQQILELDLTQAENIKKAKRLQAVWTQEAALYDYQASVKALESETDPAKRYDLIKDLEDAHRAMESARAELDQKPMPAFESAPCQSEVNNYEMQFLIDSWMPADCLTILTGPGGIGKSYLSLQYMTALAMGYDANIYALMPSKGKLPDEEQQTPIDIVIASYEETRLEVWKRIKRICDELQWPNYDELSKRIHYVDLQGMGPRLGSGDRRSSCTPE